MNRMWVWQPWAGRWYVICRCCWRDALVAQISSWERAMEMAWEHIAEVHR